jgi:hypothetical protein
MYRNQIWELCKEILDKIEDPAVGLDVLKKLIESIPTTPELEADALDRYDSLLNGVVGEEVSGTITHPNGVGEVDALEVTPSTLTDYPILLLDMNALTQKTTIRNYVKVNGVDYRLLSSAVFPDDFPTDAKAVPIVLYPLSVAWKFSLQSAVAEGADRAIPYRYVKRKA